MSHHSKHNTSNKIYSPQTPSRHPTPCLPPSRFPGSIPHCTLFSIPLVFITYLLLITFSFPSLHLYYILFPLPVSRSLFTSVPYFPCPSSLSTYLLLFTFSFSSLHLYSKPFHLPIPFPSLHLYSTPFPLPVFLSLFPTFPYSISFPFVFIIYLLLITFSFPFPPPLSLIFLSLYHYHLPPSVHLSLPFTLNPCLSSFLFP